MWATLRFDGNMLVAAHGGARRWRFLLSMSRTGPPGEAGSDRVCVLCAVVRPLMGVIYVGAIGPQDASDPVSWCRVDSGARRARRPEREVERDEVRGCLVLEQCSGCGYVCADNMLASPKSPRGSRV